MKSPLKGKPLRNPGQSVDEHIHNFLTEDIFPYFFLPGFFIVIALLEWYQWATNSPPAPIEFSLIALLTLLYAVRKFVVAKRRVRALRLGRDGEKVVGQYLESLREIGAKVFHDIQGEGFNLDHVVIDKSGIYVIETKTFSKPEKGQPIVTYDGERISINGREPDRNPVIQVRAACHWLKNLLKESTGKECNPRPVVVFPGWFVQPTAESKSSDVWVLNPKALPAFISNSKPQYKIDEASMFSCHLSRYARVESGK
ncbi:MAG: NERD domain-containing protein [Deltaproteobacteria bacterium]|nr:NERD domain-containing protein [Deltaproteobacteria bacterium]